MKPNNVRLKLGWIWNGMMGVLFAGAVAGCSPGRETAHEPGVDEEKPGVKETATAVMSPTEGYENIQGEVIFAKADEGLRVQARIYGLEPGLHGFHIHEKGDCSAPDASSAGDHFNPTGTKHGSPDADEHHVGDLGNLEASTKGEATITRVYPDLSLEGENSIVGKAVVIHAKEDDFQSQPSGNAGARVACGVIELRQ